MVSSSVTFCCDFFFIYFCNLSIHFLSLFFFFLLNKEFSDLYSVTEFKIPFSYLIRLSDGPVPDGNVKPDWSVSMSFLKSLHLFFILHFKLWKTETYRAKKKKLRCTLKKIFVIDHFRLKNQTAISYAFGWNFDKTGLNLQINFVTLEGKWKWKI